MSRFRLFVLAMASFLAVVGESLFKKSIAVGLCGILTFNSASCYGLGSGVNAAIANQGELSPDRVEIAVPPRIREAPVDLQDALADDFGIVSQNPFSTGRNEILFTSPSTGVEQKYSVNLPGTGNFQLFEVEFNKVSVPNPEKLVGEGDEQISEAQIQQLLNRFEIKYHNNIPSKVIFADGSTATFNDDGVIISASDGQQVNVISLTPGWLTGNTINSNLRREQNACRVGIRSEILGLSKLNNYLVKAFDKIDYGVIKRTRWVLAFGSQSLIDSTAPDSRNVTIDEVACRKPVECGEVKDYDGGSEIRTDLFHLQPGSDRSVNLDYEFYQIPDRLEIYYNGEIRYAIPEPIQTLTNTTNPPQGFLASGRGTRTIPIDDGVEYVGVKLIGNANQGTKWTYQISCSGEYQNTAIAQAKLLEVENNRSPRDKDLPVRVFLAVLTEDTYKLDIDIEGINQWTIPKGSEVIIRKSFIQDDEIFVDQDRVPINYRGVANLGTLKPGKYQLEINYFKPSVQLLAEKITFQLYQTSGINSLVDEIEVNFVAEKFEDIDTFCNDKLSIVNKGSLYRVTAERRIRDMVKGWFPGIREPIPETIYETKSGLIIDNCEFKQNEDGSAKFTMDIYNRYALEGVVQIYNKNSNSIKILPQTISAYKAGGLFGFISRSVLIGDLIFAFDTDNEGWSLVDTRRFSQKTSLSFEIQKDEQIKMSLGGDIVTYLNLVGLAFNVIDIFKDYIDFSDSLISSKDNNIPKNYIESLFLPFINNYIKNANKDALLKETNKNVIEYFNKEIETSDTLKFLSAYGLITFDFTNYVGKLLNGIHKSTLFFVQENYNLISSNDNYDINETNELSIFIKTLEKNLKLITPAVIEEIKDSLDLDLESVSVGLLGLYVKVPLEKTDSLIQAIQFTQKLFDLYKQTKSTHNSYIYQNQEIPVLLQWNN